MDAEKTPIPKLRRHSPGKQLLAWAIIAGLAALVLWLASERNARQWFLVPEEGQLTVKRGILFPAGRARFKTDDPVAAQTYAPLKPPAGAALPPEQSFDDRAGLDQALYDLLSRWARQDIASEKPELLERGLGYVARGERLAGVSAAQREDLRALRAESGYYEALWLLERGAEDLRLAREKLRLAADSPSRHAADALVLLHRVDALVEEASKASRYAAERPNRKEAAGPAPTSGGAPEGATR
jgi:hypothetical protein